jgi:hypothetical protein
MAKISEMSLPELYERKMTGTVEKAILLKENFAVKSDNWCSKVCKLNCKNPPTNGMFNNEEVDILIIQDYKAFTEPKFRKQGTAIERTHQQVIDYISKRTLHRGIAGTGLKYAVTTMLKCGLAPQDIKKGKAPTDTVIMKCRPYLLEEIRQRNPKVIISLSKAVTNALGFKKSNSRDQGDILEYNGIPVVLTIHPKILLMLRQNASGAMWGPDFYSLIERDFTKAAQIFLGKYSIPDLDSAIEQAKKRITIARSIKDVVRMTTHLGSLGLSKVVLSFDTETTGLDPFHKDAKIICMQFGFRNEVDNYIEAYVFPMWHRGNTWYDPGLAWALIKPLLENENVKKTGHNIKFDCLYVEATLGVRIAGILFDTMLLLHAINSGMQGTYGLKRAVGNWLPDSGLQGYEDKLPRLTKGIKDVGIDGIEGDEEEFSSSEESEGAED